VNWRIPIKSKLPFAIIWLRLDGALFECVAVDASDCAALSFSVGIMRIACIGKSPEAVASVKIFPAAVRDAAGILRIADP